MPNANGRGCRNFPIRFFIKLQGGKNMLQNFTVSVDLEATGSKIKELRYRNHYTVSDLAEVVGSSENTIFKWQRGDCLPTIDNLLILSKLFETPMDDIIQCKERGDEPLSPINGCLCDGCSVLISYLFNFSLYFFSILNITQFPKLYSHIIHALKRSFMLSSIALLYLSIELFIKLK